MLHSKCGNCGKDATKFTYVMIAGELKEFCNYCRNQIPVTKDESSVGLLHSSGNNPHAPKMTAIDMRHLESRTPGRDGMAHYPAQFRTRYHN